MGNLALLKMKTTKEQTIEELRQLVEDLWEVRGYGIPEMELLERVSRLVPNELHGMRPIGPDGLSLVPDIIDGKISYTKYFE